MKTERSHIAEIPVSNEIHESMDVTLAREVETSPHMASRSGDSLRGSRVESSQTLVLLRVLYATMEIIADLVQKWSADSLSNTDLARLLDTVFLEEALKENIQAPAGQRCRRDS